MATGSLTVQPHLYIGDSTGRPLDYGRIYFGEPNKDPEYHPINIFYDPELTVAASQPVRTKGGFMNAFGDMVEVYAIEQSYSVKVLDESGVTVFYKSELNRTLDINTTIRANNLLIAPSTGDKVGQQVFEYRDVVDLIWTIVPAGIYLKDSVIANASITGDKIAKDTELNTPKLSATYAITTLDAGNLVLAADGTLKTSTRKAGVVENDLVVRGADGYPTNNNAIGVGQTWQDMTNSRAPNVAYQNTTNRPVQYMVGANSLDGVEISSDGLVWSAIVSGAAADGVKVSPVLPVGWYIRAKKVDATSALYSWWELK